MNSASPASGSDLFPDTLLIAACGAALATLAPVALYQTHAIPRLPDPPGPLFASEEIVSSKIAHPLGIPDALLGLASFSATLGLALCARRSPLARRLLGAKLMLDGSTAAFNAGRQVVVFGRLCSWCTGTALAAGVMVYAGRSAIRDTCHEAASIAAKIAD